MKAIIAEALTMGDEGHNRNSAGSLRLCKRAGAPLARAASATGDAPRPPSTTSPATTSPYSIL